MASTKLSPKELFDKIMAEAEAFSRGEDKRYEHFMYAKTLELKTASDVREDLYDFIFNRVLGEGVDTIEEFILWLLERTLPALKIADGLFQHQPTRMTWREAKSTAELLKSLAIITPVSELLETSFEVDAENKAWVVTSGHKGRRWSKREEFTDLHLSPEAMRAEANKLMSMARASESNEAGAKRKYSEAIIAHSNEMAIVENIHASIAGGFLA
jgi:hypothetical protein